MRVYGIWEAVVSIMLAALGGMARLLNREGASTFQVSKALSELFIAAFVGGMAFLVAGYMQAESSYLLWLFAGIAGWVGPKVLDMIANTITKTSSGVKDEQKK